jgi:hypothetical protein
MIEKLTLENVFESAPRMKELLKQRLWYPMSYMAIPSLLEKTDRYIEFLKAFDTEDSKKLCDELIALRLDFRRDPLPKVDTSNAAEVVDLDFPNANEPSPDHWDSEDE